MMSRIRSRMPIVLPFSAIGRSHLGYLGLDSTRPDEPGPPKLRLMEPEDDQRWYGETEMEIPMTSELYNESHSGGWQITREDYFRDKKG